MTAGTVRGGAQKASNHFDKKEQAVQKARTINKNQGTELIIHRENGRIQRTDSHGNDPCPPKDKM